MMRYVLVQWMSEMFTGKWLLPADKLGWKSHKKSAIKGRKSIGAAKMVAGRKDATVKISRWLGNIFSSLSTEPSTKRKKSKSETKNRKLKRKYFNSTKWKLFNPKSTRNSVAWKINIVGPSKAKSKKLNGWSLKKSSIHTRFQPSLTT